VLKVQDPQSTTQKLRCDARLQSDTMSDARETEILVHITAPSRASDDAIYRALAAAYLGFESARRTVIDVPIAATGVRRSGSERVPPGSLETGFTPDASFASVLDNLQTTPNVRASETQRRDQDEDAQQSSWQTPPSVVQDSCPDNRVALPRYSSPTRILEFYLSGFDSSQSDVVSPAKKPAALPTAVALVCSGESLPMPSPILGAATTSTLAPLVPVVTSEPGLGLESESVPESEPAPAPPAAPTAARTVVVIPESPPMQATIAQKRPRTTTLTVGESDGTVISSSNCSHDFFISIRSSAEEPPLPTRPTSSPRAHSDPPPAKRLKQQLDAEDDDSPVASISHTQQLPRSSSDMTPSSRRIRRRTHQFEVHSPPPGAGVGEPDPNGIVTPELAKLAAMSRDKNRFRPLVKTRELRPFERGFWLIDCAKWDDEQRADAWEFLGNYIAAGCCGWGTWCRRAEDTAWIRVYCWGQVVEHVYYAIYLASKRRLLYMEGVSWLAADGKPVLVMKPVRGVSGSRSGSAS
jgi:hypothetical protein